MWDVIGAAGFLVAVLALLTAGWANRRCEDHERETTEAVVQVMLEVQQLQAKWAQLNERLHKLDGRVEDRPSWEVNRDHQPDGPKPEIRNIEREA